MLNSNVEYTRATKNPASPYTSYSRTGLALNYQNTFAKVLRFNFGVTANIGGMNTEDDPDAQKGEWEKVRDNVLRANTSFKWLLNRPWITSLDFDASLNYTDNLARKRTLQPQFDLPSGSPCRTGRVLYRRYAPAGLLLDQIRRFQAARLCGQPQGHVGAQLGRRAQQCQGRRFVACQRQCRGRGVLCDPSLAPNGYRPRPVYGHPLYA